MSGLIELPSFVLACIFLNKVGRKWPNVGTFFGAGTCCLLMAPFIATSSEYVLVAFFVISQNLKILRPHSNHRSLIHRISDQETETPKI